MGIAPETANLPSLLVRFSPGMSRLPTGEARPNYPMCVCNMSRARFGVCMCMSSMRSMRAFARTCQASCRVAGHLLFGPLGPLPGAASTNGLLSGAASTNATTKCPHAAAHGAAPRRAVRLTPPLVPSCNPAEGCSRATRRSRNCAASVTPAGSARPLKEESGSRSTRRACRSGRRRTRHTRTGR